MSELNALKFYKECVGLLQSLIAVPSFSNEEEKAADIWQGWLERMGAGDVKRFHNNVYVSASNFNPDKPILLLNSHLDTVKPVSSYTRDPFEPKIEDGRLYGLGSNDAGASGVTLAASFLSLKDIEDLPVNLLLAISASEERMGEYGMRAFLPHLKEKQLYPDMAIVGEPTSLEAAIAEKGLVVLDAIVEGKAGHAARNNGINAISRAIEDIAVINNLKPSKESEVLGPLNINITMINAGTQHNIIPDRCTYVVDVRTTDAFPNEEIAALLSEHTSWTQFSPRSVRVKPSVLNSTHPLYIAAKRTGLTTVVSPTTSDMALMHDIPSLKIGPGESYRSHSADEFIYLSEIRDALEIYPHLILNILIQK